MKFNVHALPEELAIHLPAVSQTASNAELAQLQSAKHEIGFQAFSNVTKMLQEVVKLVNFVPMDFALKIAKAAMIVTVVKPVLEALVSEIVCLLKIATMDSIVSKESVPMAVCWIKIVTVALPVLMDNVLILARELLIVEIMLFAKLLHIDLCVFVLKDIKDLQLVKVN